MRKTKIYKGYTINRLLSGWYSVKSDIFGYLKADTLSGIKKMIDNELNRTRLLP